MNDLKDRLDSGDAPVLVDVREHFEREIADLPEVGQLRIPLGELPQRAGELEPAGEIVLYCRTGARSAWATALLINQGYEAVLNLSGGVLAWREEIDPTLQAY